MNLNQLETKLLASSYIVMGLVGTIAAVVMLILYISTNVNDRSHISSSNIVIDSIHYKITNIEYHFSDLEIWSNTNSRYWTNCRDEVNKYILSNIKQGDTVTLKYGKSNVITTIKKGGVVIFEEQNKIWYDIIQFILMGAVFGFIAYWGGRTMKK
jgi:hypothetical protein